MLKIKKIMVYRKINPYFLELKNGDRYDSVIRVINIYNNRVIWVKEIPFVNTDFTEGYKGGILSEGIYRFIIGMHKNTYKAVLIYKYCADIEDEKIKVWTDLNFNLRTLPSNIPNPNHKGEKIITFVNIHKGGISWDYSNGCITILSNDYIKDYYQEFIDCFEMNEKGILELI